MKKVSKKDMPIKDRYTGVLLERMESNFKQVLEGHVALGKEIKDFRNEFNEFREEVNYKFNIVFEELRDLKKGRIADLERRIGLVEERLARSQK